MRVLRQIRLVFAQDTDEDRSVWWWAPWRLTSPWKVFIFHGCDEDDRQTLAFHLGPLGCLIVARPGQPRKRYDEETGTWTA